MRVFKNSWFSRFAAKEAISDDELRDIVGQLEAGQADADLGGHVYKQRIPRPGEGKAGGYRVIVFFRSRDKTFFPFGFPKSEMANISEKELRYYKKLAKRYLVMSEEQLKVALKAGEFIEI
ncbi:addiction module toxin RelE [Spirochaetia bacterium]|nr:addiction module toxin RelE [Spirochaetia bacterium]GHV79049.1 addiction module toxin RelE [Spirochaetia bacterium]